MQKHKHGHVKQKQAVNHAFTIIELLVVIVIIAILAAITLVAYTGISQEAIKAALKSDLANAATSLKAYNIENSAFPNSISDCPTPSPGNTCLRPTSGNSFSSYSANNTVSPKSFSLTASNGSNIYIVTSNSSPVALAAAPLNPVADWLAMSQGDHYGNYYDLVTKQWATVTRAGTKTIYDPSTNHIYDVPANYLGINPRSDGKGGSEAVIEESRTNYLLHSYFDVDSDSNGLSDGWSDGSGTATLSVASSGIYGKGQRMVHTSGMGNERVLQILTGTGSSGEVWTGSAWVTGSATGTGKASIRVQARDASNVALGNLEPTAIVPSSTPTRLSVSYTLPANTYSVELQLVGYGSSGGNDFDLTFYAAQLEKGAFATSYIPTTTAAATRNADNVTVPTTNWSTTSGTVFTVGEVINTVSSYMFRWIKDANNVYSMYQGANNQMHTLVVTPSTTASAGYSKFTQRSTTGEYDVFASRWGVGTNIKQFVNGVTAGSNGGTQPQPDEPTGMPNICYVGSGMNTAYLNGYLHRISVYPTALSDADVGIVGNTIKDGLQ